MKNWLIMIITSQLYGELEDSATVLNFTGADEEAQNKVLELCQSYKGALLSQFLNGTNSIDEINSCDGLNKAKQYSGYVQFADALLHIIAYDAAGIR